MFFSNLKAIPGIPFEKDKLRDHVLSALYKQLEVDNQRTRQTQRKIKLHRVLEYKRMGVETSYLNYLDLMSITNDILQTKSLTSAAFRRHGISNRYPDRWAVQTVKYSIDQSSLKDSITKSKHANLEIMQKYEVLNLKSILSSKTYAGAFEKLRSQLKFAERLQEKDDQLAAKDQSIEHGRQEIKRLQEELVRNKSGDWKENAVRLARAGKTVTGICKLVGLSRGTVSTYLNKPEVKLLLGRHKSA